jgi:hypothetical protein
MERLHHIGAQAVALALQVQLGDGLAAPATAMRAPRLPPSSSGWLRVTVVVLVSRRVSSTSQASSGWDQPGLAPLAVGNADFAAGGGQFGVLGKRRRAPGASSGAGWRGRS